MNPYDFVRIDWQQEVKRHQVTPHNRFAKDSLSGRIEGTITTLTPFFIPHSEDLRRKDVLYRSDRPITFVQNGAGQHIIPGSSLKGLFRSVVETVGVGCWWLYDGEYRSKAGGKTIQSNYRNKLPSQFRQCSHVDNLCGACRLFGMVNKDSALFLGKVNFDDAVCPEPVEHPAMYTPVLDTPKPQHQAWYLDQSQRQVAGRKFYFHFYPEVERFSRLIEIPRGGYRNSYLKPVGVNSCFSFSAHFNNIEPDDWSTLLYALTLERRDWGHRHDIRHKLGYAKPAGLGSVEVQLTKLTLVDYRQRYRHLDKGIEVYKDEDLRDYVNQYIKQRFIDANNVTLQDLRRIWDWPPDTTITYQYPDWNWFNANPTTPIDQTP